MDPSITKHRQYAHFLCAEECVGSYLYILKCPQMLITVMISLSKKKKSRKIRNQNESVPGEVHFPF